MSPAVAGSLLGLAGGLGLALALAAVTARRGTLLEQRVLPYVRDLPGMSDAVVGLDAGRPGGAARRLIAVLAGWLDRTLGGSTSVRRRLERAGVDATVADFRIEQVVWGLAAFAGAATLSLLVVARSPERGVALIVFCFVAFVCGALLRENRLTAQVTRREREVLAEFPTIAELLALAVSAGEGPAAALSRVVERSTGELSRDLARVLADIRTGATVPVAFDRLAARTGLPVVARFAEAVSVAVERGTPLAGVLHAQAGDVREAGRRQLIESGARKEIAMMVPVVFLVLPVTVVFAFWPGLVGLRLVTP